MPPVIGDMPLTAIDSTHWPGDFPAATAVVALNFADLFIENLVVCV